MIPPHKPMRRRAPGRGSGCARGARADRRSRRPRRPGERLGFCRHRHLPTV